MEVNTQRRAAGLREKIPDIKKTLEMVKFLKMRRDNNADPLETNFELNDTLYARATVDPADTEEVYLWLGANVMLAYPIGEAETMLTEKLSTAELSLANCDEDLEFLREQITVCISSFPFISHSLYIRCSGALELYMCGSVLTGRRRWRLLPLVCITGTSCSVEKTRRTGRATKMMIRQRVLRVLKAHFHDSVFLMTLSGLPRKDFSFTRVAYILVRVGMKQKCCLDRCRYKQSLLSISPMGSIMNWIK